MTLVNVVAREKVCDVKEAEEVVENYYEVLDMLAKALCFVLNFAPGGEVSFTYPSSTCDLVFKVSKN